MRHDRTGEEIEDDEAVEPCVPEPAEPEPVPHDCDRGFVDRNADPPLKPCLICKPHLAPDLLHRRVFGPECADDPLNTTRNLETS